MRASIWLVNALLILATAGCSSYSEKAAVRDVVFGDPDSAPVATRMTPALQCVANALARDRGDYGLDVYVMPFATSDGVPPDAPWQKTIDALQKAAPPGLTTIVVRDGRADWEVATPRPEFFGKTSITGRVVLERDLVARDIDFALEGSYYATAALGIAADTKIDRMEVSIYLRGENRVVSPLSATVSAVYRSTVDRAFDAQIAVVDAGGLGAAGGVLRVTSKEQILRHLIETGVFALVTRYFSRGHECLTTSSQWANWRDEYHRLDESARVAVKRLLMRRVGDRAIGDVVPVWDQALTIDEFLWARTHGLLADADVAVASTTTGAIERPAVVQGAAVPSTAPGPDDVDAPAQASAASSGDMEVRGRLYLINGRLVSGEDGYAECFAVDGSGTRVLRLAIRGGEPDGQIFKQRAYPVDRAPAPDFARLVCYRTAGPLVRHLPTAVRDYERAHSVSWDELRRVFEERGSALGVVEATL